MIEGHYGPLVFPPFSMGSTLKEMDPIAKSLPLKVDPVFERLCHSGKQTGSLKSCFPCRIGGQKHEDMSIILQREQISWGKILSISL